MFKGISLAVATTSEFWSLDIPLSKAANIILRGFVFDFQFLWLVWPSRWRFLCQSVPSGYYSKNNLMAWRYCCLEKSLSSRKRRMFSILSFFIDSLSLLKFPHKKEKARLLSALKSGVTRQIFATMSALFTQSFNLILNMANQQLAGFVLDLKCTEEKWSITVVNYQIDLRIRRVGKMGCQERRIWLDKIIIDFYNWSQSIFHDLLWSCEDSLKFFMACGQCSLQTSF